MKRIQTSESEPEEEFVRLLTTHQSALQGFLFTLMPGSADCEDVLQNVNATLWKSRDRFTLGTDFRAWMFKVARFQVMAWRKTKVRRSWLLFDDDLLDRFESELEQEEKSDAEGLSALRQCLSKLGDAERDLVLRRYEDDFSINDYARENDQNPTNLRGLLFRIRAGLRVCVERTIQAGITP